MGYQGRGVMLGNAPVRKAGGAAVVGDQPVRFATRETIVVEDTKIRTALRYYDTPARYFRRLSTFAPLQLDFVLIDKQGDIDRVLRRADEIEATAVAVRVML